MTNSLETKVSTGLSGDNRLEKVKEMNKNISYKKTAGKPGGFLYEAYFLGSNRFVADHYIICFCK